MAELGVGEDRAHAGVMAGTWQWLPLLNPMLYLRPLLESLSAKWPLGDLKSPIAGAGASPKETLVAAANPMGCQEAQDWAISLLNHYLCSISQKTLNSLQTA